MFRHTEAFGPRVASVQRPEMRDEQKISPRRMCCKVCLFSWSTEFLFSMNIDGSTVFLSVACISRCAGELAI